MNQRFSITPANAVNDSRLTDSVYRTLAAIGIYGDKNGWCWPSQSTLANLRGVSRQTINTHTKDLIAYGYLNIQPRYDEETGAQKSNMMQIKFDFEPDLTGGVKSMTLQGGASPGLYTPPQALDLTHNALKNGTSNAVTAVAEKTPIDELVDYFIEITHCREPNGDMVEKWVKPLVAIYKTSGESYSRTKDTIRAAVSEMRDKNLTIANPGSIQNVAVSLKQTQRFEVSAR